MLSKSLQLVSKLSISIWGSSVSISFLFAFTGTMITLAVFYRAMSEIYAKIDEFRTDTINWFTQKKEQLEHQLKGASM
jgi:archaellum component FlaF (FlaF/FlaG flagellin family)